MILIVNNNTFCFTTIDKVFCNITRNRMQNPIIKIKMICLLFLCANFEPHSGEEIATYT
jgi:hypothetical protein